MKTFKRVIAVMMTVLLLMSTFSVGLTSMAAKKKVKKIKLNKTSVTMYVGDTYKLKATVSPSNATNKKLTWTSSNKKVATVSSSGKITAKKSGKTTITVKAKDGSGKKATCKVTVKNVAVKSVKLNKKKATIKANNSVTLKATVSPSKATDKTVTWKSSNTKVATVNSKGVVTGKKSGTATITVTTKSGKKKATCKITVSGVGIKKISLSKTSISGAPGSSVTLKATTSPSKATNKTLEWKSSNTKVATVNSKGKVTFVKDGTATITAAATDGSGKKATCKVTVKTVAVTSVKLSATTHQGLQGTTKQLTATVYPSNATNKTVKWTTSNSKVATVDSKGLVRLIGGGTATITATSGSKKATCKITVTPKVSSIRVTCDTQSWYVGKSTNNQLVATVSPSGANQKVTWSSSASSFAKVDANGTVTVLKADKTLFGSHRDKEITITATATDGSGKKGTYTFKIVERVPVDKVTFSSTTNNRSTFYVGQKWIPDVKVTAADTSKVPSETGVSYSSSDPTVAKVLSDGTIQMLKAGTATITATSLYRIAGETPKTATLDINVEDVQVSVYTSSLSSYYTVGDEFTVRAKVDPVTALRSFDFEVIPERDGIVEAVSYSKSGILLYATFRVVGTGTTKMTVKSKQPTSLGEYIVSDAFTITSKAISVDRYHEGLKTGDTVTITPAIVGCDTFDPDYFSYSVPLDYSTRLYMEELYPADGKGVVQVKGEIPEGAYIEVVYKESTNNVTLKEKIYFSNDTYTLPSGTKAELFGVMKNYSAAIAAATEGRKDTDIRYIGTNVTDSSVKMSSDNALLNGFMSSAMGEEDAVEASDLVYGMFTDPKKETEIKVSNSEFPAAINCSLDAVDSVTVTQNPDSLTYTMTLKLKKQSATALNNVGSSEYAKAMPVIDTAYVNGITAELKEASGGDGLTVDSVTAGTVTQVYDGGTIAFTINKATNKVEKAEYHFTSDITAKNANMHVSSKISDLFEDDDLEDILGVLGGIADASIEISTTASFTTKVDKTDTYYNLSY